MNEKRILIGNRVPKDFFVTKGSGESDIALHAGSYHLALKKAGIEMTNIMTYSSILPAISNKVEYPGYLEHGCVLESIISTCNSTTNETAIAGIIYGWLYDKLTGKRFGGLVCENTSYTSEDDLKNTLKLSLNELYINGFDDKYELRDKELLIQSFTPEKKFGTALVAICFVNYEVPIL